MLLRPRPPRKLRGSLRRPVRQGHLRRPPTQGSLRLPTRQGSLRRPARHGSQPHPESQEHKWQPCKALPASIQDPFRGNVPQREDLLEVWADSSSSISFRKQEAVKEKRGELQIERRRKRGMLAIEAEAVRERCRKRLRVATSASVAFDECDTRKVVRVRCDTLDPPHQWDGVIGIIRKRYGVTSDTSSELKDDHAAHNLRLLRDTLRAFYTPLPQKLPRKPRKQRHQPAAGGSNSGGELAASGAAMPASGASKDRSIKREKSICDDAGLLQFRKKVRILASDGGAGERRALFLAARVYFPNADFAIEDPAHGLRIATVKPLQLQGCFAEIQEELVNKRHALLPDIQNSGKWKQMLRGLATSVLRMPGLERDGALKVVLHHLAYAKIRMDSAADPLAKLCLMLLPVAFLLSFISSDERCLRSQRDRAAALLSKSQPQFLLGAGVCADWGLICIAFLRLFDRLSHDISNSADELDEFCDTIEACFIRGGVFCRTPKVGADGQLAAAVFITERVRKQMARKCVFHCGSSDQVVWGPIGNAALKELAEDSRHAAEAMLERVKAKLAGLRQHFSCFALRRIRRATETANVSERPRLKDRLHASLRVLGKAFKLDSRILVFEYDDAVPVMMLLYDKALRAKEEAPASGGGHPWFDNRPVWAKLLDKTFVERAFRGRVAPFTVLPTLLRVWISILDGESQVERDLGFMREFVRKGKSRSDDRLLEDLLLLKIAGPKSAEEVRGRFAYRCAELWRWHHGSAPMQRKRRTPRQPAAPRTRRAQRRPSFADAKRAVLRASARAKLPRSDTSMTEYGVTADFFKPPAGIVRDNSAAWSEGLKKFHRLSQAYKIKNRLLSRFGRRAFPAVPLCESTKQCNPLDYSYIRLLVYLPAYNEAACGALAAGYESRRGLHACKTAHIVIIDELARLHSDHADVAWVLPLLYIVARGLPLTTCAVAKSVHGDMQKIPATGVREHEPQMRRRVRFRITHALHAEFPALATGLRGIEQMPSSAWRVQLTDDIDGQPAAPKAAAKAKPEAAPQAAAKAKPKAAPKAAAKGKRKATAKVEEVGIPDLATMWAWLRRNRRTVNAKYTRMCWRGDLPTSM